jgi:hypothetical protein
MFYKRLLCIYEYEAALVLTMLTCSPAVRPRVEPLRSYFWCICRSVLKILLMTTKRTCRTTPKYRLHGHKPITSLYRPVHPLDYPSLMVAEKGLASGLVIYWFSQCTLLKREVNCIQPWLMRCLISHHESSGFTSRSLAFMAYVRLALDIAALAFLINE